jgi:hypothetical protein
MPDKEKTEKAISDLSDKDQKSKNQKDKIIEADDLTKDKAVGSRWGRNDTGGDWDGVS